MYHEQNQHLRVTSLTIGNFACASGYTLVPGDVDGWGTVCGQSGAEKVSKCAECAAKCLGCDGCRSYKCSVTELKCSLNSASKPAVDKNSVKDAFCVKGLKKRGGACDVIICILVLLMHLKACRLLMSLPYSITRDLLLKHPMNHVHPRTRSNCRSTELQRDQSFKLFSQEWRVYNRTSTW